MDLVIRVDEADQPVGTEEKLAAHQKGLLHRAFSVFLFNGDHQLLIQQRAAGKYHSGGLWTNTCCSHPAPGEDTFTAAHRRLKEEMGLDCTLTYWKPFYYHAAVGNNLIEHEIDHLFTGRFDGAVHPNDSEVQDYRYISLPELEKWIAREPAAFTEWFKLIFPSLLSSPIAS